MREPSSDEGSESNILMNAEKITLRAETFAGRIFRVFRVFGIFSRKFLPGKKLNKKFAKVNFANNIKIGLQLSKMKPLHAGWIVDFYNLMITAQGKEIIDSGWKAAGIADAFPPIDPFNDIDPILEGKPDIGNQHLLPIADISPKEFELLCGRRVDVIAEDSSNEDLEWEEEV